MDDLNWTEAEFDEEFDEPLRARIKGELEPGEPLLWAGRPVNLRDPIGRGPITAAVSGLFLLVLAAVCAALASRFQHRDTGGIGLIIIVALVIDGFIALGLYNWARARKSTRQSQAATTYALTDRRVIVWQPVHKLYGTWQPGGAGPAIQVASYPMSTIREINRVEYPDGSGDIQINRRGDVEGSWSTSLFTRVADVRRIERLIRDTLLGPIDGAREIGDRD